jgi:hypothetical protein
LHGTARFCSEYAWSSRNGISTGRRSTEKQDVRHIISQDDDVPEAPPRVERRRNPDRRTVWRGGRRDTDWLKRPSGHLDASAVLAQRSRWRELLQHLNLSF